MSNRQWDRVAILVLTIVTLGLIVVAWFASQLGTKSAFDSIHGVGVFGYDDTYRFFLSSDPFRSVGLWFWSFYLPGNIMVDGALSFMSDHNQYFMRVVHVLFNMTGMVFIYKAGVLLNISRRWLFLSLLTLLLMPLNMLLSMSFYGESLLAPLLSVAIYCTVANKKKLLIIFSSIMPFFRPEGAFYLGAIFLDGLRNRKYRLLFFLALPSALYFIAILIFFQWDLSEYYDWRIAFIEINDLIPFRKDAYLNTIEPFYVLNAFWWLLGFLGFFVPKMKPLRFLCYGALLVLVFWGAAGALHARNETRYLYPMFPLLALSQAAFFSYVIEWFEEKRRALAVFACSALMLFVLFENFLQMDVVRNNWFDGGRWPISSKLERPTEFTVLLEGSKEFTLLNDALLRTSINQVAEFTYAYTEYDSSIRRVIIQPFFIFNELNGRKYRRNIMVDYATIGTPNRIKFVEEYVFTLIPEPPQYGLYKLYPPEQEVEAEFDGYALFVDYANVSSFIGQDIKPIFSNHLYRVFKVNYKAYKLDL